MKLENYLSERPQNTISIVVEELKTYTTKFFVDIGASNVTNSSQTEQLIPIGWGGILFECDEKKYPSLQQRYEKNKNVTVIPKKVTPDNILDFLEKNNAPNDFYLSLDIDGYDYFVLDKILSKYKPSMILSEINEKIPPPFKFTVEYDENYWWDGTHFYGYSISMLENLLTKYGYKIMFLHYNNVCLVPGKHEGDLKKIYEDGYLNAPLTKQYFSYNNAFKIVGTNDLEKLNFINNFFISKKGKYHLSI